MQQKLIDTFVERKTLNKKKSHRNVEISSILLSTNLKIRINRTISLPGFFLYGCETWSLKLREERRLRVFENRV